MLDETPSRSFPHNRYSIPSYYLLQVSPYLALKKECMLEAEWRCRPSLPLPLSSQLHFRKWSPPQHVPARGGLCLPSHASSIAYLQWNQPFGTKGELEAGLAALKLEGLAGPRITEDLARKVG